jgi:hypothetical protein
MKRRFIPILPFTVGLVLSSGLAYVLAKNKQAKSPLPRRNRREKREHGRLNLYAHALVKKEGSESVFSGEISNISDMGVYLTTNGLFSKDDLLDLTIYFQHGTNKLSMTVPCRVARNDGKGVGLTSSHIDAKMLQHLELIFDESKDDTKQLIEEFYKTVCSV